MPEVQKPLAFREIGGELFRVYHYPNGYAVRLDNPVRLSVAENGDHRILTGDGRAHLLAYGWVHVQCQPKPGMDPFATI